MITREGDANEPPCPSGYLVLQLCPVDTALIGGILGTNVCINLQWLIYEELWMAAISWPQSLARLPQRIMAVPKIKDASAQHARQALVMHKCRHGPLQVHSL